MYTNLNDAAVWHFHESLMGVTDSSGLAAGDTQIWYKTKSQWREPRPVQPATLGQTHILLGTIACKDPEKIFVLLQGEVWSPSGEAREMIRGKGLNHTSMSVGDVVVVDGRVLEVANTGFEFRGNETDPEG
jgi:hypothetical protein